MSNVIVTGASKGIGSKIALAFAREKSLGITCIVLVSRNERQLQQVRDEVGIIDAGIEVLACALDLSDAHQIVSFVDYICGKLGNIDYLINNAGYANPQPIVETEVTELEYTYRVNVFAPFVLIRELTRRGIYPKRIVNIASTAGMTPRPGWAAYASSKAALISLSQTAAAELRPYGTRVICLSPGRCATELRRRLAPDEDQSSIMQPEDVASVVIQVCGPIGDVLDQQCIMVRKL